MYTGLRVSELMAIRFQDIDARNGLLRVRNQLARKGGVLVPLKTQNGHRDVVLADAVLNALSLRTSMPPHVAIEQPNDLTFQRETGGPLSYQAVRQVFMKARDDAGLSPRLKPHSCRHTYASMMILDARVNVVFLSRQLGHSKVSITLDKYAHWFDRVSYAEETRAALERAIAKSTPAPRVDTNGGHTGSQS
jgi:integrase